MSEDNKVQKQIGLCKPCVPLSTEGKDRCFMREGKPMKKRMPSLLLAALLLVQLVSCSNNVSDSSETKGETDTETAASASSDESVETEAETDPLA